MQMRKFAGDDEDSDGETEGPDKHAESAVCCAESPPVGYQAERGAAKRHLQQTSYSHRGCHSSGVQIRPSCALHHLSGPADNALKAPPKCLFRLLLLCPESDLVPDR